MDSSLIQLTVIVSIGATEAKHFYSIVPPVISHYTKNFL